MCVCDLCFDTHGSHQVCVVWCWDELKSWLGLKLIYCLGGFDMLKNKVRAEKCARDNKALTRNLLLHVTEYSQYTVYQGFLNDIVWYSNSGGGFTPESPDHLTKVHVSVTSFTFDPVSFGLRLWFRYVCRPAWHWLFVCNSALVFTNFSNKVKQILKTAKAAKSLHIKKSVRWE